MKKTLSILLTLVFLFSVSQSAPGLLSFLSSAYADSPQLEKRITGNGHTYYFFSSDYTWTEANAYAKSIGGHLATITSQKEQNLVQSLVEDYGGAWLGGTDEEEEGTWKWVTGEAFSYQNWDNAQPDNANGCEHFLQIISSGVWNDLPEDYTNQYQHSNYPLDGFVAEFDSIFDIHLDDDPTDDLKRIPVIKYKGHYYTTFTDNMTWEEAREYCEYYGGHL